MTQLQILKVLKRKKKWMTAQEIADILKINSGSVSTSLKKLRKYGEITFKESDKTDMVNKVGRKPYLYKIK